MLSRFPRSLDGSVGVRFGRQKRGALTGQLTKAPGTEPDVETAGGSLDRQNLERQLLRQPLSEVRNTAPLARQHLPEGTIDRLERELERGYRHWNATESAEPSHPKADMSVTEPDLRELETDARGDSLPQNRHFRRQRIALTPQMEITKIFSCGEELVETPLYAIEIESQVKSVPTGEWRRQKIFHDRKYR